MRQPTLIDKALEAGVLLGFAVFVIGLLFAWVVGWMVTVGGLAIMAGCAVANLIRDKLFGPSPYTRLP